MCILVQTVLWFVVTEQNRFKYNDGSRIWVTLVKSQKHSLSLETYLYTLFH